MDIISFSQLIMNQLLIQCYRYSCHFLNGVNGILFYFAAAVPNLDMVESLDSEKVNQLTYCVYGSGTNFFLQSHSHVINMKLASNRLLCLAPGYFRYFLLVVLLTSEIKW